MERGRVLEEVRRVLEEHLLIADVQEETDLFRDLELDSVQQLTFIVELENAFERAVLVCDGNVVHAHHLPPSLQTGEASGTTTNVALADAVGAYEKDLLQDALKTTRGNRVKAAKLLDSTERIVSYKVKKHGIDCRRFR